MTRTTIDPRALRDDLRARIAPAALDAVDRIVAVAEGPVYAAGGAVRDAILGRALSDIDLVVEGDAIELFRMALPGIRATVHTRFRTASVVIGGTAIDLTTARSETYARPGALPKVAPADIFADMRRRDFSVNAVALRLNGDMALIDACGGVDDLAARRIRVLHEASFIDDPTRIYRALRYAARLEFDVEPQTDALLRVANEHVRALSGERVRREIELMIEEPTASTALRECKERGALTAAHSALTWSEEAARGLDGEMAQFADRAPFGFALLAARATPGEAGAIVERLRLHRDEGAAVGGIAALMSAHGLFRRGGAKPSGVVVVLDRYPVPAVAAFAATAPDEISRDVAHRYLAEWRNVKPLLNGRDLQGLGVPTGPQIQRGLQLIRAARLDGWAGDRGDEKALAIRFAKSIRDSGAMNASIDLHANGN